ncbi:unnamed protein product [Effrenium voratum]|uniref:Uncharacterized protein n=1 Tax=Effrenium voratum TaxID=2562239 RepID=A0AA36MV99_9DINO|nr:unnamed protein product [Effrenium voratum]
MPASRRWVQTCPERPSPCWSRTARIWRQATAIARLSEHCAAKCEDKISATVVLLRQDTSDSDNQLALFGFLQNILKDLTQLTSLAGLWGVSPRQVDLSFPGAFNKAIVGNRPDFRAFEPVKNYHEGTDMMARADEAEMGKAAMEDSKLVLQNEIRRTYAVIMRAAGLDPNHKSSWELMLRCFPCMVFPFPQEHLLSHHYFAREYLFDRGDLDSREFGDPLTAAAYNVVVDEIDGEVATDASGAYDRKADVSQGLAQKRRQRARKVVQDALDRWDTVLGCPHAEWIDDCELVCRSFLDTVTDVIVMAPITMTDETWSKLRAAKRLWGMFFALDNAAEYGHWVVDDKAKNIFRNNFNTALDEQGTLRMLKQIHTKELRAHFHPTELFKGELGQVSWADARDLVKPVHETMSTGGDLSTVSPMLGVYNCYNCAKSPKGEPQQISDPLTVFEFLNFSHRFSQQDVESSFNPEEFLPVASYSPSLIMADHATTEQNFRAACDFAKSKGISEDKLHQVVRKEQVFVVKFTYEPLNNGMYTGHGLVQLGRM